MLALCAQHTQYVPVLIHIYFHTEYYGAMRGQLFPVQQATVWGSVPDTTGARGFGANQDVYDFPMTS